jgi:hypothetical protein
MKKQYAKPDHFGAYFYIAISNPPKKMDRDNLDLLDKFIISAEYRLGNRKPTF